MHFYQLVMGQNQMRSMKQHKLLK